jgi:hypothetical protein
MHEQLAKSSNFGFPIQCSAYQYRSALPPLTNTAPLHIHTYVRTVNPRYNGLYGATARPLYKKSFVTESFSARI